MEGVTGSSLSFLLCKVYNSVSIRLCYLMGLMRMRGLFLRGNSPDLEWHRPPGRGSGGSPSSQFGSYTIRIVRARSVGKKGKDMTDVT